MDPNTLFMYMSIIGPYLESQPYDSLSNDKKRLLGQIRQLSTDSTIANGRFHKPPFIIKRSVEMVPKASKKLCIMRGKCVESGCQIDDNIFKNDFCAQNMNEMCSHKAC